MCGNGAAALFSMKCRKRRSKCHPRKARSKTKKPKFLSLRRKFPAEESKENEELSGRNAAADAQELNLFPQQPEINRVDDRENYDHENETVADFFSAGDGSATTLTGLLDFSADHESNSSLTDNNNFTSRLRVLPPPAVIYGEDPSPLVRNALRSRERDAREETWVSLSEVVKEEEVSSTRGAGTIKRLLLKLDYEEIIDAWSNKGSLYIDPETPQIVPDINHQFTWQQSSNINNQEMNWGCDLGYWKVPETAEDEVKRGKREASVLRYKEKRRKRLFSHKIRYQVRKLNAEKRPRLKGRFVKREAEN